jgi:hypothetical protein
MFHKHVFKVFSYIRMFWLVENIYFLKTLKKININSMWCGKLYFGTFVDKKRIQSKYNVIISKFKMLLEIERYVHNHYDFII